MIKENFIAKEGHMSDLLKQTVTRCTGNKIITTAINSHAAVLLNMFLSWFKKQNDFQVVQNQLK